MPPRNRVIREFLGKKMQQQQPKNHPPVVLQNIVVKNELFWGLKRLQ
jgi:hypothetical protein